MPRRLPREHAGWCGAVALGALVLLATAAAAHDPAFDSGPIERGQTWTLDTAGLEPGRYNYTSRSLDWLRGILHVGPDTDNVTRVWNVTVLEGASADRFHFEPKDLQVERGDLVVWHNTGTRTHSVTEGPWEPWPQHPEDDHEDHGEKALPTEPRDLRAVVALSLLSLAAILYVWGIRMRREGR